MITFEKIQQKQTSIAIVGLGYVGLPLAVHLARHFSVIGFDINALRINELSGGYDKTCEVSGDALKSVSMVYTADPESLKEASFVIVAVPTPVNEDNTPDMSLVEKATSLVGSQIQPGTIVVYESTVYPGATEEICVPLLEQVSGLKAGIDFFVGYSPERINPGDKTHTIDKVIKIVSGMNEETLDIVSAVYGAITQVHRATSIRVAEAAKVIENAQRDINIAFMNELAQIFSRMGISTHDVLAAAQTKWNFLPFTPGLVGGHCIGVDPYYLTHKAKQIGFEPKVILAGREINDTMHIFFRDSISAQLQLVGKDIKGSSVALFGATFKENVPDVRNSRIMILAQALQSNGAQVYVCDPHANTIDVQHEYNIALTNQEDIPQVDVVLFGVAHDEYKKITPTELIRYQKEGQKLVCVDIKNLFNVQQVEQAGFVYWSL
jgi:UDP-N-acetyl-D-glucosamine/UDP-N-acetyl-D-galactosamine dehydrogenase